MKIGIITEGQAEQQALKEIVEKIKISGISILSPLFASVEPKATPEQIAKAAESRVKILQSKQVDKIIMILDLENLPNCPGVRATEIKNAFVKKNNSIVEVVIKNKCFENWLISDIEALEKIKGFEVTPGVKQKVKNKADNISALSELKKLKKDYHKSNDGLAISKKVDPLKIAENSRSFRRFLRLLSHPKYISQSINP